MCSIRNCSIRQRAPAWCARSSAGSAIPRRTSCRCAASGEAWASEAWDMRRDKIFLLPGDLPAGSRLPLASLPRVEPADYPIVTQADPFAETAPLPDPAPPAQPAEDAITRTALAVEPRDGRLNVFMPFVGTLEDYLAVVSAVENAAADLQQPVHLEGYAPPADARADFIKVTPDPGVIEVNLQAATSWREAVAISQQVYDCARLDAARHVEIHARRAPHRHRRRQPHRGRRRDAGRQPVPAPARTCSRASSSIGSAIPRSLISSPACSSARPASRRASTRRVTRRCTNSKSRSRKSRRPAKRCARG